MLIGIRARDSRQPSVTYSDWYIDLEPLRHMSDGMAVGSGNLLKVDGGQPVELEVRLIPQPKDPKPVDVTAITTVVAALICGGGQNLVTPEQRKLILRFQDWLSIGDRRYWRDDGVEVPQPMAPGEIRRKAVEQIRGWGPASLSEYIGTDDIDAIENAILGTDLVVEWND